ncbi:MAG: VpaChn25_0724 family phage protein [Candidatus Binataceae bacterium]
MELAEKKPEPGRQVSSKSRNLAERGELGDGKTVADSVSSAIEREARLAILRFLVKAPCYTLNDRVLFHVLDDFGICLSHDRLDRTLSWLQAQQFVRIDRGELEDEKFAVVELTVSGSDVADGRVINPEISRPQPGDAKI